MAGKPKPEGAISNLIEYRVAMRVSWRYKTWLYRHHIDHDEFKFDLLPNLIKCGRLYDPSYGKSEWNWLWRCAKQELLRLMDRMDRRHARRKKYPHLRHATSVWDEPDMETRETAALALAAVRDPRKRQILSMWCGGMMLRDIGRRFGVTTERVRQLRDKALKDAKLGLMKEANRVGSSLEDFLPTGHVCRQDSSGYSQRIFQRNRGKSPSQSS
jgi:hypothetical protein